MAINVGNHKALEIYACGAGQLPKPRCHARAGAAPGVQHASGYTFQNDNMSAPYEPMIVLHDSSIVSSDPSIVSHDSSIVSFDPSIVSSDSMIAPNDSPIVAHDSPIAPAHNTIAPPDSPIASTADRFRRFADTGARLADLHLNYEHAREYPLRWIENKDTLFSWRVTKMKLTTLVHARKSA